MKYPIYLLLLVSLILSSCKTKTPSGLRIKKLRAPHLVAKIEKQQNRPEWFASKYKGKVTLDNKRVGISGHIRLRKDSLMWFNVKVFGFEVARAQASQDSIWFVNSYQNEFYKGALPSRYMNFTKGQLYQLLEDIITNQMTPVQPYAYKSKIEENDYQLSYEENNQEIEYLVDPIDFFVNNVKIEEKEQDFDFTYDLNDFYTKDGYTFARKRKIDVFLPKSKFLLDLKLSNIIVDVPQKMPFTIPQNYTQIYNLNMGM